MLRTTERILRATEHSFGCTPALAAEFGVPRDSGGGIVMRNLYLAIAQAYEDECAATVGAPVENPWGGGCDAEACARCPR